MQFYETNPLHGYCHKNQYPPDVVEVSHWYKERKPYDEGTREKMIVYCSAPVEYPFLIPQHRYLFKESNKNYPEQFWAEIVAYLLGRQIGVPVPPAFVAQDNRRNKTGALIEWFYDYPGRPREKYMAGSNVMIIQYADYDLDEGTDHNFRFITNYIKANSKLQCDDWYSHWGKIFTFDAIIGNTDRHQDNWGLVLNNGRYYFSPAFDNGTSLGHEILEVKFDRINLEKYIARGIHKIKWERLDERFPSHRDFLMKYVHKYPQSYDAVMSCLNFDLSTLAKNVEKLTQYRVIVPLTKRRADFMIKLIEMRVEHLSRIFK